jgi:metal-responsive CopG/Arc/MetJ family transcriptional regulator
MSTTVHLPPDLLKQVNQRARELRVSRNQYVKRALERALREETRWSPSFLAALEKSAGDAETQKAVAEMMGAISRRCRKQAPKL